MKKLLFSLLFCFGVKYVQCQTFILLDRKVHQHVTVTDTVTRQRLSDGYFPVYKAEYDSMVILIDKFTNLKDDGLSGNFIMQMILRPLILDFKSKALKELMVMDMI